jgi:hypothetical protein
MSNARDDAEPTRVGEGMGFAGVSVVDVGVDSGGCEKGVGLLGR